MLDPAQKSEDRLITRFTTTVAAASVATLLVTGAVRATTFGTPDGNRHPYVGTIIFETPSGVYSCSGTQMNSRVLLTAGHCTEESGVANLRTWAKFDSKITFPGRANYGSLAAYLDDPKNGWTRGDAIPHPQYDDFAEFPRTYDIGVVILKKQVSLPAYGALPPVGFLEGIRTAADNNFTVVGYGMQGLIRPFYEDKYERYMGTVKLLELNSTYNGGQSAKYSNNPGTGGGSCFGDSGGPVFYADTNMVTSVVSWGITPCIGVDYQFRTDTTLARQFLDAYLR